MITTLSLKVLFLRLNNVAISKLSSHSMRVNGRRKEVKRNKGTKPVIVKEQSKTVVLTKTIVKVIDWSNRCTLAKIITFNNGIKGKQSGKLYALISLKEKSNDFTLPS